MSKNLPKIVEIIRESVSGVEIDESDDGDRTFKELGIDSLDKMSLLLNIQEHWSFEFAQEQINDINTINEIDRALAGVTSS